MQYRVKENGNDSNECIPSASPGEIFVDFQARGVDDATPGERHEEVRSGYRPVKGGECLSRVWECFMRTLEGLVSILDQPHPQTIPESSP